MKGGTMYEQREVVLILFPYSGLTGSKQRPALIISNKNLNKTEDRICCLITSQPSKEGIKITHQDFQEGSLPFESYVKPHRLFTIHYKIIKKSLCRLNVKFYDKIKKELDKYIEVE